MSDAFFEALKNLPVQDKTEPEYRLYYDPASGTPLFYSMEDVSGTYITVDKSIYNQGNYHCRVDKGRIIDLNITGTYRKLVPAESGTITHPTNVMIIDNKGTRWKLRTYED